jgi:hypothetical protein
MIAFNPEPSLSSPGESSCSDSDRRRIAGHVRSGGAARFGGRKRVASASPSFAVDLASAQ